MTNPAVREALADAREIELTVTGRKSGRQSSRPVWFVQQDDSMFLMPVTGSDSDWYKNVRRTPMVEIARNGMALSTSATPITDADRVRRIEEMFRAKYGSEQVDSYYPKRDVAVQVALG
ncbi:nitroreductase/quinone reductase family protein [Micromonospora olivasterospora]|uniref:Deazaflavin-dependent oxidoreductase (Nitroreductase family) n=1 Tax=Micromonospora olivasterospora TaxID=1880 RepID=A0A562ID19_MICOL|nr:nitroreductase/quinone reductase family protein [Micromonospora olivasterospora]TWH68615.1 deazaflavin-dependent oxidoreductase (nitroreductase family) [Micromonospora olivasterospora]